MLLLSKRFKNGTNSQELTPYLAFVYTYSHDNILSNIALPPLNTEHPPGDRSNRSVTHDSSSSDKLPTYLLMLTDQLPGRKTVFLVAGIIAQRNIVPRCFFYRTYVPVNPQNIGSSTRLEGIGVSDVVSENLSIAVRTTASLSIAGEIHSAGVIIVVKAIAGAAIRSRFGVVETINEF